MGTIYRLNSDIVVQSIEGEAVVVAPENALISSLNRTGTYIIGLLQEGEKSVEDILIGIKETFDVDEKEAAEDLNSFLNQLIESKLVIEVKNA